MYGFKIAYNKIHKANDDEKIPIIENVLSTIPKPNSNYLFSVKRKISRQDLENKLVTLKEEKRERDRLNAETRAIQEFDIWVYEHKQIKRDNRKKLAKKFVEEIKKRKLGTVTYKSTTNKSTFISPHVFYDRDIVSSQGQKIINEIKKMSPKYMIYEDPLDGSIFKESDTSPTIVIELFKKHPELDVLIFR